MVNNKYTELYQTCLTEFKNERVKILRPHQYTQVMDRTRCTDLILNLSKPTNQDHLKVLTIKNRKESSNES